MMEDLIAAIVAVLAVAAAGLYVYKAKKKGKKCIGCPYADGCSGGCCGGNE